MSNPQEQEPRPITETEQELIQHALSLLHVSEEATRMGVGSMRFNRQEPDRVLRGLLSTTVTLRQERMQSRQVTEEGLPAQ
jgi:hypothetical protein